MFTVRQSSKAILVFGLVGVLSGYAWAAGRSDVSQNKDKCTKRESRMSSRHGVNGGSSAALERVSYLIGHTVRGSDGKTLGRFYDIVLTPDLNSVSYVALSRGGAFGLGRDLYAVPWSAFSKGPGNTYFLPITENYLLTMNRFDGAHWPTGPSAGWVVEASNMGMSTNQGIASGESWDVQHLRVSKLMGINVKDVQDKSSGHIRDFVIARNTGQIVYSIVSSGGFLGLGNRYAAVPAAAIHIDSQRHVARLTVGRSTLVASSFSSTRWPDLSSPAREQQIATQYGTQPPSGVVLGYVAPERNMPESNVNVQPKAKMHGTNESACRQGSASGYQTPPANVPEPSMK